MGQSKSSNKYEEGRSYHSQPPVRPQPPQQPPSMAQNQPARPEKPPVMMAQNPLIRLEKPSPLPSPLPPVMTSEQRKDPPNPPVTGPPQQQPPWKKQPQVAQRKVTSQAPKKKALAQKKGSPPRTKKVDGPAPGDKQQLKMLAEMETKGRTVDKMEIPDGARHNFESLFARFMGGNLTAIRIVEPYLMNNTQFHILFHFIECCVFHSPNLELIQVITKRKMTKPGGNAQEQQSNFNDIGKSLSPRGIRFVYEFETLHHDRSIVFSNGFVFRIGRGMDLFQQVGNQKFFLGMHDQRLLSCKKTTIFIDRL